MKTSTQTADIFYPDSDGKPMAESDLHRDWMFTNIGRLKRHYSGQRVYVSGNLLIHYAEGNPKRSVAPDTFVVKDCDPRRRRIFKIWEEGESPMPCWRPPLQAHGGRTRGKRRNYTRS